MHWKEGGLSAQLVSAPAFPDSSSFKICNAKQGLFKNSDVKTDFRLDSIGSVKCGLLFQVKFIQVDNCKYTNTSVLDTSIVKS